MISAATWAGRARGQEVLQRQAAQVRKVARRCTALLLETAGHVLDLVLQSSLEREQVGMHIVRDPDPRDPGAASLQAILRERLEDAKVTGKTGHRAARLLERLGLVEVSYVDLRNGEILEKPKRIFSKKRKGYFYCPMLVEPTRRLLEELGVVDPLVKISEAAPAIAALVHRAAAEARRGDAVPVHAPLAGDHVGQQEAVQSTRQGYVQPVEVRTRGGPGGVGVAPDTPEGTPEGSDAPTASERLRRGVLFAPETELELKKILGEDWRRD